MVARCCAGRSSPQVLPTRARRWQRTSERGPAQQCPGATRPGRRRRHQGCAVAVMGRSLRATLAAAAGSPLGGGGVVRFLRAAPVWWAVAIAAIAVALALLTN